jgi:hypothetical protein
MRDIRRMIDRNRAQVPIIEDQAREAVRRIEKNIEALERELEIASGFLREEKRARNKRIAYELAELGVDQIGAVDKVEDQDALHEDLLKLLEEAKNAGSKEGEELDDFLDSMKE